MTDIRAGELQLDLEPASDARLRFIGRLRTPWSDRSQCPRQGTHDGPDCTIEVFEPWHPALKGIEAYNDLEVLYWLHESRRDLATQSPKWDGKTTGTFALRSPVRPNPIGLARVRLIARSEKTLTVRGLDCLDGTPLIDIKPDRCAYTPPALPKKRRA